jgi:hypothetical protein
MTRERELTDLEQPEGVAMKDESRSRYLIYVVDPSNTCLFYTAKSPEAADSFCDGLSALTIALGEVETADGDSVTELVSWGVWPSEKPLEEANPAVQRQIAMKLIELGWITPLEAVVALATCVNDHAPIGGGVLSEPEKHTQTESPVAVLDSAPRKGGKRGL